MTGAAHTSATASIFQRPMRVRSPSALAASCGSGSECTVSPRGWSKAPGLAAGEDELEPDIEDGDQGGQRPPLEGITEILLGAAAGLWPLAQQPFGRSAGLLHRQRQQWQPCF